MHIFQNSHLILMFKAYFYMSKTHLTQLHPSTMGRFFEKLEHGVLVLGANRGVGPGVAQIASNILYIFYGLASIFRKLA